MITPQNKAQERALEIKNSPNLYADVKTCQLLAEEVVRLAEEAERVEKFFDVCEIWDVYIQGDWDEEHE
jgi:hypothetical protein